MTSFIALLLTFNELEFRPTTLAQVKKRNPTSCDDQRNNKLTNDLARFLIFVSLGDWSFRIKTILHTHFSHEF